MGKNRKQKKKRAPKRNGRPSKLHDLTSEHVSDVRWLASKGLTNAELAEHFGVSERTFIRWRNRIEGAAVNTAIIQGQEVYGKPSAELGLCVLAEIDRLQGLWLSLPFHDISKGPSGVVYYREDQNYLGADDLMRLGLDPESDAGLSVLAILRDLESLETALDMIGVVESMVLHTDAWKRYSNRAPLRWNYLTQFREKWKYASLIFGEEGDDKTPEDADIDQAESGEG